MRTIIGPFCKTCGVEMKRVEFKTEHGAHGEWIHATHSDCIRPDVTWAVKGK